MFSLPKPLLALTTMSRSSEKETDKDRLPHSPSSERNVGTNTEVAGTEPYYSVPVLQNVLSEGGVTSRLYSVQVMTQSELDYHRQHSSQNQVSGKWVGASGTDMLIIFVRLESLCVRWRSSELRPKTQ